jgi:hypothetical protein
MSTILQPAVKSLHTMTRTFLDINQDMNESIKNATDPKIKEGLEQLKQVHIKNQQECLNNSFQMFEKWVETEFALASIPNTRDTKLDLDSKERYLVDKHVKKQTQATLGDFMKKPKKNKKK